MDFTTPQIITIVVALIGAVSGILGFFKGRRKEKADVAQAITEAAANLIEKYESRLIYLEEVIEKLEGVVKDQSATIECQELKLDKQGETMARQGKTIEAFELERDEILKGVLSLCAQVRNLGLEPAWEPKSPNG